MTERIALRDRLQCESFQWYLDNIAVDVPQHILLATGEIFSPETKLCLDKDDKPESLGQVVGTSACHMTGGNQYWMYRSDVIYKPKSKIPRTRVQIRTFILPELFNSKFYNYV